MKKVLIIILLFSLLIIVGAMQFYWQLRIKEIEIEKKIVDQVLKSNIVKNIISINYFALEDEYYVVEGEDSQKRKITYWVNDKKTYYLYNSMFMDKEKLIAKINNKYSNIKIKKTAIGMIKGTPILEIFFTFSENNNLFYAYQYYNLITGDEILNLRLTKIIK